MPVSRVYHAPAPRPALLPAQLPLQPGVRAPPPPRPCRPSSCSWRPRDSAAPAEPRPPGTRPHTGGCGPGRGHVVVRGLSTAPRLEAVRGYGEEERVAQSGGSTRCVPVCCLQGVRIARTASTARGKFVTTVETYFIVCEADLYILMLLVSQLVS